MLRSIQLITSKKKFYKEKNKAFYNKYTDNIKALYDKRIMEAEEEQNILQKIMDLNGEAIR